MKRVCGLALVACLAFFIGSLKIETPSQNSNGLFVFSYETAEARPGRRAVRRTARRTARRTTRRVVRRRSVAGCPRRHGYYYCGGVYYAPSVYDGETVYIVVNP